VNVIIASANDIPFEALPKLLNNVDWVLIESCYSRSDERWIGAVDDKIACIWGLIPPSLMSDQAYIWLYHNDLVEQYKLVFIRHSQIQVRRMLAIYPRIIGDCVITNTTGRRWLQWLGAQFEPPDDGLARFEIKAKAYG
jgi:hypothetical protein